MMFPRTYGLVSSETRTLPKNTAALEALCQHYPGKVNVMLVPAASAIYPENVPAGAPLLDEGSYLNSLSDAVQAAGGRFVDVRQTLTAHKDEYIYYRTLHPLTPPPTRPCPQIASTAPTTPRHGRRTQNRTPSLIMTCRTN